MFLDFIIPVPAVKGKVFINNVCGVKYVHYQYDSVCDPVKKYSSSKRTTIGKLSDEDPSLMYPVDRRAEMIQRNCSEEINPILETRVTEYTAVNHSVRRSSLNSQH